MTSRPDDAGTAPGQRGAVPADAGGAPEQRDAATADAGRAPERRGVVPAEAEGAPEQQGVVPDDGAESDESGAGQPRSGLRNPAAAVRGLGAGTLVLEAVVLLLAIQPIRIMGGDLSGWGIGVVIGLAVLAALIAGMMGRRWAWGAGAALQALLIASGLLHWSLAVVGVVFAAAWAYATHVRRTILG